MRKRIKKSRKKIKIDKSNRLKVEFKRRHGYDLNLASPRTFSEKIQWIKIFGNLKRFSKYVDKYEVRQYVKEKVGEQYLIPLIGVYDKVDQIKVDSLPDSFALKPTHASGWNLIVNDKTKFNWDNKKNQVRNWLNSSYFRKTGESNYRDIKPRVVIEELIKDPTGDLKDYKIFCFHGEPKFIQVDGDRFKDLKRDIYDLNWDKLPVQHYYPNFNELVTKPSCLNELLTIAKKLSAEFAFVRVDLYYTNDKIFFGELTFTPENGLKPFKPKEYDELFGQYLELKRYE